MATSDEKREVATRLLNAFNDLVETVAEAMCECIASGFRALREAERNED